MATLAEPLQSQVYVREQLDWAQLTSSALGSVAVFTRAAPGKNSCNEDAAAVLPVGDGNAVLAVADGVGGLPEGEHAAGLVLDRLRRRVARLESGDSSGLRGAILDGIEAGSAAVRELGVGAATTLAVVEIQRESIRPYHVGDATILVVGQRGKIKCQTVAHSPVGYAVESGFLDASEAMQHDERHFVSNVVGAEDMHVSIGSPLRLDPRDTVLLASDGLMDNLHVEEIVELVRKGPLDEAADHLAGECLRRMREPLDGEPSKCDDLTFVLYRRD